MVSLEFGLTLEDNPYEVSCTIHVCAVHVHVHACLHGCIIFIFVVNLSITFAKL